MQICATAGVHNHFKSVLLSLSLWALTACPAFAQSAAFSYRGHLTAAGSPVNGPHDMQFKLFDTANAGTGTRQGDTKTLSAVPVANGVFTVTLDFGAAVFDGSPRFLEISVRPGGSTSPYSTLDPRQQVASIPYAIRSLNAATAATALTVASGSAVTSLNNLKDNVTLEAGPNVTITPSGNMLTIASTGGGGGGSSLWSLAGTDAYYNAGNVGIGTSTPANKLTVRTPTVGYGFEHTDGDIRLGTLVGRGIGYLGTLSNHKLTFFANNNGLPNMTMSLDTAGAVGIGTDSPTAGIRLEVNGAVLMTPGNGKVQFGSPNTELGMSIIPTIGNGRADLRFIGSTLKLVAGGPGIPPAENGIAITTLGNVGIGTTTPSSKLEISAQDGLAITGFQPFLTLRDTSAGNARGILQNGGGNLLFYPQSFVGGSPALTIATGSGNVGIGTTTPIAKLQAETPVAGKVAVYGIASGTSSVGVYGSATAASSAGVWGHNPTGAAIHADGNATQARDKGGFVKAMAYIDPFLPAAQYVVRCYNSQLDPSTPDCGIKVTRPWQGNYSIDFGFYLEDRFISVTARGPAAGSAGGVDGLRVGIVTSVVGNRVEVNFSQIDDPETTSDSGFYIFVY